ncbi:MAG TPA: peptidase M24 [Oceanospirillaceae bacterium]|nr:peptidase M24 [Oceanospirillaceae bacterium]
MDIVSKKFAELRNKMIEERVDLVALAPGAHVLWLLGFTPHPDERPCLLLIGKSTTTFLMPALNADAARQHTSMPFFSWSDDVGPVSALHQALAAVDATSAESIVLDETMRADFALLLMSALPNAKPLFTQSTVGQLRMRKDASDYQKIKHSALLNDRAMQAGFAAIGEGVTELEVADAINKHYATEGAKPQFCIVASGPNGAYPHHQTGSRRIQSGDAILIDTGGRIGGFPSDMTRMSVLNHLPEGYQVVHDIVERAVKAAMAVARPGVKAKTVDEAARSVITAAGYGEFFVHRTGHGLGIDIHEPPYITATSEVVLEEGMVFSIEPGIYLPGRFGIRLEEIVYLRPDGPEVFSELTRRVNIIQP